MAHALEIAMKIGFDEDVKRALHRSGQPSARGPSGTGQRWLGLLEEISGIERILINLRLELDARQEDGRLGRHLHADAIEARSQALLEATASLASFSKHKAGILARLQEPFTSAWLPVEAAQQGDFLELLTEAAGGCSALLTSLEEVTWLQAQEKDPSSWAEIVRPIPAALAACDRLSHALFSMSDSMAAFQALALSSHPAIGIETPTIPL